MHPTFLMTFFFLACPWHQARGGARAPEAAGVRQDEIVVKSNPQFRETVFSLSTGDCRISWTVYESEVNRRVIRHRSDCALSLAEQAPLIGKVLRRVMVSEAHREEIRTLSWGRLYPDGTRDSTLAARLALAAMRSAEWDPVQGRPRSGDINGWVRKLANEAPIYDELRQVFREAGLEIRMSAVEKVLVLKAKLLPFFDKLREAGIRSEDKVPFDCQAWFSIG